MAAPYIGEIRMFAGNFAPQGWATGDGQNTFGLPNLAARLPIHIGSNGTSTYTLAQNGGVTSVTLTTNQIPNHTHPIVADGNAGSTSVPSNAYFAAYASKQLYTVPNSPSNPQGPNF